MFGKCCDFSESEIDKASKVREFYFGSEDISLNTIQGLHTVATLVSSHKQSAVYEYMFTHKGKFSFADILGLNSSQFGVCHADEVHYIFNPHLVEYPALAGEDFDVRNTMVKLWLNFADSGKPVIMESSQGFQWNQFETANQAI